MSTDFSFILSSNNNSSASTETLLSNNTDTNAETVGSVASILFTPNNDDAGFDAFGGKDVFGTPDLSDMDGDLFANASQTETVGSVAYNSTETVGSVACASVETAGSVACADSGSSGGESSFSSFG